MMPFQNVVPASYTILKLPAIWEHKATCGHSTCAAAALLSCCGEVYGEKRTYDQASKDAAQAQHNDFFLP